MLVLGGEERGGARSDAQALHEAQHPLDGVAARRVRRGRRALAGAATTRARARAWWPLAGSLVRRLVGVGPLTQTALDARAALGHPGITARRRALRWHVDEGEGLRGGGARHAGDGGDVDGVERVGARRWHGALDELRAHTDRLVGGDAVEENTRLARELRAVDPDARAAARRALAHGALGEGGGHR